MARKRLGCFTGPAILAVVLTLLAIAGAALAGGGGLFSPGVLSAQTDGAETGAGTRLGNIRSHAELGGQSAACHPAPWEGEDMADRCMVCHSGIQAQLGQPGGFHAVLLQHAVQQSGSGLQQGRAQGGCRECHPEHRGATAALTLVRQETFPHEATGYALSGHQESAPGVAFSCADCHPNDLLQFSLTICTECHARLDTVFMRGHETAYGADCLACHDGKDSYGKAFDHNNLAFKLDGRHAGLDCGQCHTGARTPADLKATKQGCTDCHARDDAHQGQLGTKCSQCHSSEAWKPASMDHDRTGFPLIGKHATAGCQDCHANNAFKGTSQACAGCHAKDDVHKAALGTECQSCHSAAGWTPAAFDHAKSDFPLTGKHAAAACADCHPNKTFVGTPQSCEACHLKDDSHGGRLGSDCGACHTPIDWGQATLDHALTGWPLVGKHVSVACAVCHQNGVWHGTARDCLSCHRKNDAHSGKYGTDCGQCHTPVDWEQATFDHAKSGFPLTGKHGGVSCVSCHPKGFANAPTTCVACHQKDDAHGGKLGAECSACHSTNGWQPATFDHNRSGFPLTGAHTGVSCQGCHGNGFAGTPKQCSACHQKEDAHGGQFGTDCEACHSTSAWKPASFDHSRSGFPLTGAHAGVTCQNCHANGFAGTSRACESCHREPAYHAGLFPTGCSQCHNTSRWAPASFNGSHTFPVHHGDANSCRSCHPNNLNTWSCASCHSDSQMAAEHREAGGFNSNCIACHPNAQGHERD